MDSIQLQQLGLSPLTDGEMGLVRGGDSCSDLEKAIMILWITGQLHATAFLIGIYVVAC